METKHKRTIIQWLKRVSAVLAVAMWGYVIFIISQDPAPFAKQVPYCMGSTMLIFGILTGIYKGLEYWEAQLDKGVS